MTMFNRVVMNVIQMLPEIIRVLDKVFPKSPLPNSGFPVFES